MAAELLTAASRALDPNASPYPGAQWFFYATGTLTPQAVFANGDLSTSLGAVVTADGGGRFVPIYLDANKAYRGIQKDAAGNTLPGMDIDPINPGILYQLGQEGGAGMIGVGNGLTQADLNDEVVYVSLFIPKVERSNILAGTPTADVTTYLDAALDVAKATGRTLKMMAGTYLVSTWLIDGANYAIDTSAGVTLKQISGHSSGDIPAILLIDEADDVAIGDINFVGNIATDPSEFHHAVVARKSKRITLGRLYGTDIRGDVLYCYGRTTSDRERLDDLFVESISGSNVYRNLLPVTGGTVRLGALLHDGPVGYRHFDIEPNTGGAYQPSVLHIGYVKAGCVEVVSADPLHQNDRFSCDTLDLDWDRIQATTPAYPSGMAATPNAYALGFAFCRSGRIGLLKVRNYKYFPINLGDKWDSLRIDTLDIENCVITETTFGAAIVQQGTAGTGWLDIGTVKYTPFNNSKWLARANAGALRLRIGGGAISGGLLAVDCLLDITGVSIDCAASAGLALVRCGGSSLANVSFTNAASATLLYDSDDLSLTNVTGTFSSLFSSGGTASDRIFAVNSVLNGVFYRHATLGANQQNSSGSVTFTSGATKAVTFATAEANATYRVVVTGSIGETFWVTAKGTGGFTINSSNPTSTAVVDWQMFR